MSAKRPRDSDGKEEKQSPHKRQKERQPGVDEAVVSGAASERTRKALGVILVPNTDRTRESDPALTAGQDGWCNAGLLIEAAWKDRKRPPKDLGISMWAAGMLLSRTTDAEIHGHFERHLPPRVPAPTKFLFQIDLHQGRHDYDSDQLLDNWTADKKRLVTVVRALGQPPSLIQDDYREMNEEEEVRDWHQIVEVADWKGGLLLSMLPKRVREEPAHAQRWAQKTSLRLGNDIGDALARMLLEHAFGPGVVIPDHKKQIRDYFLHCYTAINRFPALAGNVFGSEAGRGKKLKDFRKDLAERLRPAEDSKDSRELMCVAAAFYCYVVFLNLASPLEIPAGDEPPPPDNASEVVFRDEPILYTTSRRDRRSFADFLMVRDGKFTDDRGGPHGEFVDEVNYHAVRLKNGVQGIRTIPASDLCLRPPESPDFGPQAQPEGEAPPSPDIEPPEAKQEEEEAPLSPDLVPVPAARQPPPPSPDWPVQQQQQVLDTEYLDLDEDAERDSDAETVRLDFEADEVEDTTLSRRRAQQRPWKRDAVVIDLTMDEKKQHNLAPLAPSDDEEELSGAARGAQPFCQQAAKLLLVSLSAVTSGDYSSDKLEILQIFLRYLLQDLSKVRGRIDACLQGHGYDLGELTYKFVEKLKKSSDTVRTLEKSKKLKIGPGPDTILEVLVDAHATENHRTQPIGKAVDALHRLMIGKQGPKVLWSALADVVDGLMVLLLILRLGRPDVVSEREYLQNIRQLLLEREQPEIKDESHQRKWRLIYPFAEGVLKLVGDNGPLTEQADSTDLLGIWTDIIEYTRRKLAGDGQDDWALFRQVGRTTALPPKNHGLQPEEQKRFNLQQAILAALVLLRYDPTSQVRSGAGDEEEGEQQQQPMHALAVRVRPGLAEAIVILEPDQAPTPTNFTNTTVSNEKVASKSVGLFDEQTKSVLSQLWAWHAFVPVLTQDGKEGLVIGMLDEPSDREWLYGLEEGVDLGFPEAQSVMKHCLNTYLETVFFAKGGAGEQMAEEVLFSSIIDSLKNAGDTPLHAIKTDHIQLIHVGPNPNVKWGGLEDRELVLARDVQAGTPLVLAEPGS